MWQCVFPSNYSDVRCQHAISKASSVGVNSHPAFDEKPGIKFVWPSVIMMLSPEPPPPLASQLYHINCNNELV